MKVSVCLPVYNGSAHLSQAIQSILGQTYSDWELLIADDLSEDNSWEIINGFACSDSRIKIWRNEKRLGLFANYNRTISSATGQFIKPFAQDDYMSPITIAALTNALQGNLQATIAACAKRSSHSLSNVEEKTQKSQRNSDHTLVTNSQTEQNGLVMGLNPGKLVILKCLAQYRNLIGEPVAVMYRQANALPFSLDYRSIGDMELWFRLLEQGDLVYVPDELVNFRQHQASRTSELLTDLDWILDWPRLSRQYARYLAQLGVDRKSYCTRFLELAAPLVKKHSSCEAEYIDALPPFKEIAYYLMHRLPDALDGEANYSSVLNSTSWRLTKPLRLFKRSIES